MFSSWFRFGWVFLLLLLFFPFCFWFLGFWVWGFFLFGLGFFMANTFVAEGLFLARREIIVMPWQPELGGTLEQSGLTKIYLKASKLIKYPKNKDDSC